MVRLVLALVVLIIVVLFSVQNAVPVSVSFLIWSFQSSLAIIIALCLLAGMVAGGIIASLMGMKRSRAVKKQEGEKRIAS
jgi:lipopolysaccharide assembly protein A